MEGDERGGVRGGWRMKREEEEGSGKEEKEEEEDEEMVCQPARVDSGDKKQGFSHQLSPTNHPAEPRLHKKL